MPLTSKGEEILASLKKQYGPDKAEHVLYAGKNKGTFTGIDALTACTDSITKLAGRFDAYCARADAMKAGK